jgi:chitinase
MSFLKILKTTLILTFFLIFKPIYAQVAAHNLVGYWHNWNASVAPYVALDQVDSRYSIIEVAFALPASATDMTMSFVPSETTQATLISQIQTAQSRGQKVLISIGGATATIDLTTNANKTAFINSMTSILNTYGFDGMDIDIEFGNSILITSGTISSPANVAQINLIEAIKTIMRNFRAARANQKMLLTMAPETAYVQGGQSAFSSIWGGYLPIIHALRDSLDLLQVQLYNSGTMYGLDGNIYTQGTADFIVALTEATIRGFNTTGGFFTGLPASKIAVGLPACTSAAGGGYASPATVAAAINYLLGKGTKAGSYTLLQSGGYPSLNGMMTWSLNWDKVASCGGSYTYASNYQTIFGSLIPVELRDFRGVIADKKAVLWWQTEQEDRLKSFDLEKSTDGKNFEKIQTFSAKNTPSVYRAFDANFEAAAYYRVVVFDLNGQKMVSKMVFLEENRVKTIKISQNTEGGILVETADKIEQIQLVNTLGQTVLVSKNALLSVRDLPKGVYIVVIKTPLRWESEKVVLR